MKSNAMYNQKKEEHMTKEQALLEILNPCIITANTNGIVTDTTPNTRRELGSIKAGRRLLDELKQILPTTSYKTVRDWMRMSMGGMSCAPCIAFANIEQIDGPFVWRLCLCKHEEEILMACEKLSHPQTLHLRDELTGVMSRVHFETVVAPLVESKDPQAFFFIDIDNFKSLNDEYGHSFGDKCLCEVANHLKTLTLEMEEVKIGRFGGDEFFMSLPYSVANRFAIEEMRETLSNISLPVLNLETQQTIPVGISAGLTISTPSDTYESLLRKADKKMYGIKNEKKKEIFHDKRE